MNAHLKRRLGPALTRPVVVLCLVASAACASGQHQDSVRSTQHVPGGARATTPSATIGTIGSGEAATPSDVADAFGHSAYPETYAGLQLLKSDESEIEVALTVVNPSVEAAFRQAVGSDTVLHFKVVANSAKALARLRQRLVSSIPTLRREGVHVTSYGDDPPDGRLDIGVMELNASVVRALDALLGRENIMVEQQSPVVPPDASDPPVPVP